MAEPKPAFPAPTGAVSWEEMAELNEQVRLRTANKTPVELATEALGRPAEEFEAEFLFEMGLL